MYFTILPNIRYDTKPISYPFSESDYTIANNFFRRHELNKDSFGYITYYEKYAINDGVKIETIASDYYGDPSYDWVIILTNNFINPQFAFPLDSWTLNKVVEDKYGVDKSYDIHHYETIEVKSGETLDDLDIIALEGGLTVDKNFYDSTFTYWNGTELISVPGNTVSKEISNLDYEVRENEKKREIFILKRSLLDRFVNEFKMNTLYSKSSDFINKRLKSARS